MPIEVTGRDLAQWVTNCIVTVDDKPRTYLRVREVGTRNLIGTVYVADENGACISTSKEAYPASKCSLWWPALGAINVTIGGLQFGVYTSLPSRKRYSRSFLPSAVEVSVPRSWDLLSEKDSAGIEHESITANMPEVFLMLDNEEQYCKASEAKERFDSSISVVSIAATRTIVLYHSGGNSALVYYRNEHVGELSLDSLRLDCFKGGNIRKRLCNGLGVY
jgi:hypothetical protein